MITVDPKPSNYGVSLAMRGVEAVTTTKTPTSAESGELYTNEGDANGAIITLPTAVAGLTYTFYVQAAQILQIVAAAGDTIRVGTTVSAAAGNIASNTVGSAITLTAINATEWVATEAAGSAFSVFV